MSEWDDNEEHICDGVPRVVATGQELNLQRSDLGHPGTPYLWEMLYRNCHAVPPTLTCSVCEAVLYLKIQDGKRVARRYTKGQMLAALGIESDLHMALKDRLVVDAERVGLNAETERRLPGGSRRPDVTITGGSVTLCEEVQVSPIRAETARARERAARASGAVSSWLAKSDSSPARTVQGVVPLMRTNSELTTMEVVTADSLPVFGTQRITAVKCSSQRHEPWHRRDYPEGKCSGWHARLGKDENELGMRLTTFLERSASGDLAPFWWPRASNRRKGFFTWLPKGDIQAYADIESGALNREPVAPADLSDLPAPEVFGGTARHTMRLGAMRPERPRPVLDWTSSRHWSAWSRPCLHCKRPTNLVDDDGRFSHKTCAEEALWRAG